MVGGDVKEEEKVPSFLSEGNHSLYTASLFPEQEGVGSKVQLVSVKGFLTAQLTLYSLVNSWDV